jgi:hypothetical protein
LYCICVIGCKSAGWIGLGPIIRWKTIAILDCQSVYSTIERVNGVVT